ncbi:hypothetical protein PR202_ga24300 [Eleusine coracana subsp. coracana]|uniref:Uncharacterized protein n=1 Tax=Eleusine coracana subsp. coracana TaxID=191504 RepID=A0AAV5D815_ELECO|nr:hypothetical protein PR202_ga24300 [Eleusine coracana subsp. coracana]
MGIKDAYDHCRQAFFWLGKASTSGANCLVAWDKVTRRRELGGLGIKDTNIQNACLLVKLIHRLHTSTDST